MAVRALITACLAALAFAGTALARPFDVPVDHAALIRLPEDASAIVVGNPSIADATLYDGRTLFVTGKLYGRTNVIALDAQGRVIYANDLVVTQSDRDTVEVFRNVNRETYVCAPECEAVPSVGDDPASFDPRATQQQTRAAISQNGTGGQAGGADEGN